MERDLSQSTPYCRSGCGFYGNPATDGLCSKCYKDAVTKKQAVPSPVCVTPSLESASTSTTSVSNNNNKPPTPMSGSSHDVSPTECITSPDALLQVEGNSPSPATITSTSTASGLDEQAQPPPPIEVKKKAKNRCSKCKVKIGVIGFPCRCGGNFCALHRYANEHDCNFDYKEHGQEEIRKNNPQVVGEKIQKI